MSTMNTINTERKLASVREIHEILPIPNADAIETAVVDGWKVVVTKGKFKPKDFIVYFEIDSWVPHAVAPFLTHDAQTPKVYEGVQGNRLKTGMFIKQISQGLVLPMEILPSDNNEVYSLHQDVTEILGVLKWERVIPEEMSGQVKGGFPNTIPKTDAERIQNLYYTVTGLDDPEQGPDPKYLDQPFEQSLKLDGTSCTIYYDITNSTLGVCQRNWELKINTVNAEGNNTYVNKTLQVEDVLKKYCIERGISCAVQGELCGPKINNNREGFRTVKFFIFNIWDMTNCRYFTSSERMQFIKDTQNEFDHVPVLGEVYPFQHTLDELLEMSQIESINHKVAEGIVYKGIYDPSVQFKVINNQFLLKGGD